MSPFSALGLHEAVVGVLAGQGYEEPTEIQARAVPHVLAGRDVLGIARTGTGKTAAFALPTLQRLAAGGPGRPGRPRALVLAPTRELAGQIADAFRTYGAGLRLTSEVVFGGVSMERQRDRLRYPVDVLVATPGRLLDLVSRRSLSLDDVGVLVLDEADQMLDLGFAPDLRRISALVPPGRQTLFFSATMPRSIAEMAGAFLHDPVTVSVTQESTTAENVDQSVIFVPYAGKQALLAYVLREPGMGRALVFCRTKHGADRVADRLAQDGIHAQAIHGNKSQSQRGRILEAFRDGRCPVLVATDVAARGIDVEGVTHVVNFDLPNEPQAYVHRIGRTARAGASGKAVSFCCADERGLLRGVERTVRATIPRALLPEGFDPSFRRPEPYREARPYPQERTFARDTRHRHEPRRPAYEPRTDARHDPYRLPPFVARPRDTVP